MSWLLLAVTGVWLMFYYRPTASAAYSDMETLRSAVTFDLVIRRIHQWLVLPAAILPLVVAVMHFGESRFRPAGISVAGFVGVFAAWFTGKLLPWDQLALWAATVGTNMSGFGPVLGNDVRFVLLGGAEISTGQLIFWLRMHTLAVPLVLTIVAIIYWRDARTGFLRRLKI